MMISAFEDVVINPESFSVTVGNEVIAFPRKEFQLLYLLAENREECFGERRFYQAIWGDDVLVGERTVDVHIRKIREKAQGPVLLKRSKAHGYKLEF